MKFILERLIKNNVVTECTQIGYIITNTTKDIQYIARYFLDTNWIDITQYKTYMHILETSSAYSREPIILDASGIEIFTYLQWEIEIDSIFTKEQLEKLYSILDIPYEP